MSATENDAQQRSVVSDPDEAACDHQGATGARCQFCGATLGPAQQRSVEESEVHTEWGVRYGDGDLDSSGVYEQNARDEVERAQRLVERQRYGWEAYAGATLVSRVVTTNRTAWEVAS